MNEVTNRESTCKHYWVLGQPEAGHVRGVCRNCGAVRDYPAYFESYDWSTENGGLRLEYRR